MGAYLEGEYFPGLKCDAAVAQHLRVKDDATFGNVAIAGDEDFIGTAKFSTKAGGNVTVRDKRAPGYHAYIASGAIDAGDDTSTAAGGKVQTGLTGAVDTGKAMNTVADGGVVFVRPLAVVGA